MGSTPLFGGPAALENALYDSGAAAVVLIGAGGDGEGPVDQRGVPVLSAYLASHGSLDVFRLSVSRERAGRGEGGASA